MKLELTQEQLAQVVNVNVPLGLLIDISNGRELPLGPATRLAMLRKDRPNIGEKGLYGTYSGIARADTGAGQRLAKVFSEIATLNAFAKDSIIEVIDESPRLPWDEQMEWAKTTGGRLPTLKEQALLFANVPELFQKEAYWSCEPYAGVESYAWGQYFGDGYQSSYHKDYELRARAVRRLPIE